MTASRTRRTAPCADAAAPRRNRAAAITGAAFVVLIVATWALRPLTFVYPCCAPCLVAPNTGLTVSSMSSMTSPVTAGQQLGHHLSQPDQGPRGDRIELADVAEGEAAQERSQTSTGRARR